MNYKSSLFLAISIPALTTLNLGAQALPPTSKPATTIPGGGLRGATIKSPKKPEKLQSFKFEGADLDTVMTQYCEWTDKIYLKTDAVKSTITLKADKLTTTEAIKVVEAILALNNIALVPMGDKYIKVVQATAGDLTGHGLSIQMDPEKTYGDGENFVTAVIQLQNVSIPEVQAAIQHVLHAYGKILTLERSNSIMITDTEANIARARELIEFIDQATAQIEPRIYQIQYADATEIASKINEIVTAAQGDEKKPTVTGNPYARTPAGVTRASATGKAAPTKATVSSTEGNSTVIIQGTVKVMADERTNIIIIFSVEENFAFFDNIIKVLDVEVEPATTFEVINLEYADAAELSGTLNDLIGAAGGSSSSSRSSSSSSSSRNTTSRSTTSNSRTNPNTRVTPNASPVAGTGTIENLNRLSEDTKILADERSNSILLMGSKSDIAAIKEVIKSLDIMLEQVIIEAAIFEVTLGDTLSHGIDWLYRANSGEKVGAWDGLGLAGGTNGINTVLGGALTYYQNMTGINTEVAINLAATDSNVRLLSTPVIMTTDNTEAHLSVGEQRPVVTSTSSFANSSGTQSSNYEYKDIGIQLTVTPRINPQRVVVMEILQKADQVGDEIPIDGNDVPVILNREFEAQISVPDRGTVALGGLINTETRDSVTKIPILGDIPFIGRYLFSSTSKKNRQTELVVLLTPYVLTDNQEILEKTERLYDATDMMQEDWDRQHGWSENALQFREKPDRDARLENSTSDKPTSSKQLTTKDLNEPSNSNDTVISREIIKPEPVEPKQSVAAPSSQTPKTTDADEEEMRKLLQSMNN